MQGFEPSSGHFTRKRFLKKKHVSSDQNRGYLLRNMGRDEGSHYEPISIPCSEPLMVQKSQGQPPELDVRLPKPATLTVDKLPFPPSTPKRRKFWKNQHVDVSENSGTPKSSILIEFSIINHPFWGTPIFGNHHVMSCHVRFWCFPLLAKVAVKVWHPRIRLRSSHPQGWTRVGLMRGWYKKNTL